MDAGLDRPGLSAGLQRRTGHDLLAVLRPAGTWFQLYINEQLAWAGQTTSVTLPVPLGGPVRIDIGSVAAGTEWTSFVSYLPPAPLRQAELSWLGGRFEGPDLAGFYVYGGAAPDSPIDYTTPLQTITAYPAGIYTDGYGLGGFGTGGFGSTAGTYTYVSDALESGVWSFAVTPFDTAGNQGSGSTTTVEICVPPREPAAFAGTQTRLKYAYSASTNQATLNWNAPPS